MLYDYQAKFWLNLPGDPEQHLTAGTFYLHFLLFQLFQSLRLGGFSCSFSCVLASFDPLALTELMQFAETSWVNRIIGWTFLHGYVRLCLRH